MRYSALPKRHMICTVPRFIRLPRSSYLHRDIIPSPFVFFFFNCHKRENKTTLNNSVAVKKIGAGLSLLAESGGEVESRISRDSTRTGACADATAPPTGWTDDAGHGKSFCDSSLIFRLLHTIPRGMLWPRCAKLSVSPQFWCP